MTKTLEQDKTELPLFSKIKGIKLTTFIEIVAHYKIPPVIPQIEDACERCGLVKRHPLYKSLCEDCWILGGYTGNSRYGDGDFDPQYLGLWGSEAPVRRRVLKDLGND